MTADVSFDVDAFRRDRGERSWPSRWFGAGEGSRTDTAERPKEILRTELGPSA